MYWLNIFFLFIPLRNIPISVIETNAEFHHRSFASGTLDKTHCLIF